VTEELTGEDRALLAALAALEHGPASAPESEPPSPRRLHGAPAGGDAREDEAAAAREDEAAAAETLTRLYLETVGLLPYALPPAAPRPETKRRLMAAAAAATAPASSAESGSPGASASQAASASPAPPGEATPAPAILARPAAPLFRPLPPRPAEPGGRRGWPLAVAAALILALLGTCGWLYRGLLDQGKTIASLGDQRDAARQRADRAEGRLARLTAEVKSLRDNVSVVTSPAVQACALQPVMPEMASARGILFVAADHQHWYMSLRGLPPAGSGKVYQLWFVADQGPVSAGTFRADSGSSWEAGSEHMPAGARAVRITLENGSGAASPGGPDVLRNADALHTL
jgi:hypothetical protein